MPSAYFYIAYVKTGNVKKLNIIKFASHQAAHFVSNYEEMFHLFAIKNIFARKLSLQLINILLIVCNCSENVPEFRMI